MAGKIKGITLEIAGDTTGLTKALKEVNKQSRDIETELRAVEKALKLDPKNTEILAQKQQLLADSVGVVEDKLEALKKAKVDADKRMAEGAEIPQEQYRALQREISNTQVKLKNINDEIDSGSKKIDVLGEKSGKMNGIMKNAGATFLAGGAALVALSETTAEYREDLNRLEVAFTSAGHSSESARAAYEGMYAIFGESDRAVEAANHLAQLTKNEEELSQWATIAAGVTATFGDSLPIEGLTEAANETAKIGSVTGVLADALNWAGENEDAFNEKLAKLNSEEERAALITDTLNGIYHDSGTAYLEMNEGLIKNREAQSELNDALADLGETVTPLITKAKEAMAGLINFVIDNKEAVVTALGAVVAGIAAFNAVVAIQKAISAFQGLKTAVQGMSAAQAALNLVMSMNPIALIVAAIAALVAAFVLLWNNCEGFRNFWIGLWDTVKNAAITVGNAIVSFFTKTIPNAFNTVVNFFKENWQIIVTFIMNPFAAVIALLYKHNEKFRNWVNSVLDVIKNAFGNIKQIGSDILTGLWKGIGDKVEWLKGQVKGVVNKIKSWFTGKEGFDEHSPSKWAEEVGAFIDEGLANGIFSGISTVQKSFRDLFGAVEKEHEQLTREEEVYNRELARIRAEGAEEQSKEYLEYLKTAAENAKEQRKLVRESFKGMVEDVQKQMDELDKEMESYKKGLADTELVTEHTTRFIFDDGEFEHTKYSLADLSTKRKELEQFMADITNLKEIGIDDTMIEQIQQLGGEEGGKLAKALLAATPEQRDLFVEDFKKIGELSGQAAAEVFSNKFEGVADSIKGIFDELDPELLKYGETWGTVLGEGLVAKFKETVGNLGVLMSGYGVPGNVTTTNNNNNVDSSVTIIQNITAGADTPYQTAEATRRTLDGIERVAVLS